uniref:Uncharacterized protein n=1 Tax=Oryza glumipatula TaxID=40148 RepID=A0A0E0AA55_9ORYZ
MVPPRSEELNPPVGGVTAQRASAAPRGRNPSLRRRPSSSLLRASPPPELIAGKARRRAGMAAAGPSSSAPPRPGAGVATMAVDYGACRDAGPCQEPRRHEGGAAPSSMLRL